MMSTAVLIGETSQGTNDIGHPDCTCTSASRNAATGVESRLGVDGLMPVD